MRAFLFFLVDMALALETVMLMTSCVGFRDVAVAANGNREEIDFLSLGGTSTLTGANGAHFTHDHQQSLRDVVTAAGTAYAAGQAAKTTRVTTVNNNAAATQQQLNQQNFQLGQQSLANQAAATAGKQAIAKQAQANGLPIPAKP